MSALAGVLQVLIFPSPAWSLLAWVALAPLLLALLEHPGTGVMRPGGVEGLSLDRKSVV